VQPSAVESDVSLTLLLNRNPSMILRCFGLIYILTLRVYLHKWHFDILASVVAGIGWTTGIRFLTGAKMLSLPLTSDRRGTPFPPLEWVPGIFSRGLKRPWRLPDNPHPPISQVKNTWSLTSTFP
jgi:hypothetical protein